MSVQPRQGTYVVTLNAANRLQRLEPSGLLVPSRAHPVYRALQEEFVKAIQLMLPGFLVRAVDMRVIMSQARAVIRNSIAGSTEYVVVSICFDLSPSEGGRALSINRIYGYHGEFIGYGPRVGCDSIGTQLDRLVPQLRGKKVILLEDGVFRGQTMMYVLSRLIERGVVVTRVVVGFASSQTRASLVEAFHRENWQIDISVVQEIDHLIDWIPDHDLVPFLPHCGRVVGVRDGDVFSPVITRDGWNRAFPYIEPFGSLAEWASLPHEKAIELSRFCLDASIELYSCIARQNGIRKLFVDELLMCSRHISLPLSLRGIKFAPSVKDDVVEYLRRARGWLE